jgi:hypothetical protein
LDGHELLSRTTDDERVGMTAWLPVIILAGAQIVIRLIGVVGMIWHERVRAKSRCAQMLTASVGGVALFERTGEGSDLAIVPQHVVRRVGTSAGTADLAWREAPLT